MNKFIFDLQRFTETVNLTEGNDDYSNGAVDVIINALGGKDTIYNGYTNNVTINAGDGNDSIQNSGDNVSIALGDGRDTIDNFGNENITILGGAGKDKFNNFNGSNVLIDGGDDDDEIDNSNGGKNSTLVGGKGNDDIVNYADNVTIDGGEDNDNIISKGSDVLINGGNGDDEIVINDNGCQTTIKAGKGNDKIRNDDEGEDLLIEYEKGDGNDVIQGFNETTTLKIGDGTSYYSKYLSGSDMIVTVGEGKITLEGAAGLSKLNIEGTEIPRDPTWNLNGTTATYGTVAETLIKVNGVTSTYGLSLKDNVVTVSDYSLNKGTVTISDGYILQLSNDVTKSITTAAHWEHSNSTATYKNNFTSAGYSVTNNQIVYNEASGGETLITVTGVTNADGLSLSGTTVTVSESSLGTGTVTISDGYTLKLGNGVTKTSQEKIWSFNDESVATYKDTTIAGYSLAVDEKSITYTRAASKTLATVKGVKSEKGLSISGDTITVSKKSLGTDKVTVSDGYKLALAYDVDNPSTTDAGWVMGDATTAVYKSSSTTAGYTLADNSIIYSKAKPATTLAEIAGAKSLKGLTINGTTIKTAANALSEKVSVSGDGYEFNFDSKYTNAAISGTSYDDAIKSAGKYVTINSGAGDDTIVAGGSKMSVSASGGNNYIQLAAKTSDQTVQTGAGFDTVKSDAQSALIDTKGGSDYIVNTGANTAINSGAGNDSVINSGSNVIIDAGDGDDSIISSGSKVTINGGKGNDTLTGGTGADVFIYALGDGNDTVTDYAEEDRISIASGEVSFSTKGNDVILTVSKSKKKGTVTIKNGNGKVITYFDADGNEQTYPESGIDKNSDGTAITLRSDYDDDTLNVTSNAYVSSYASKIISINASAVNQGIAITGNKKNNVISGGKGNDIISGGKGNDSLTGGAGADIFVWNKGDEDDTVLDYAEEDTVSIKGGIVKKISASKDKKDIIFTLASKNKITIVDGASKVINYVDDSGENSYSQFVKFNDAGTGATLKSTYIKDDFNITEYMGYADDVVSINAAAVEQELVITGNKKNNVISGGQGNDTISGGKGNDTLKGGSGSDVFVWNKGDGNDTILDYAEEDTVSIKGGIVKKISASKDKKDIILTLANKNNISIVGGASKVINYVDDSGENSYSQFVKFNDAGTGATLKSTYIKDDFNITEYMGYADDVVSINAAAVEQELVITGNKKNNVINGGQGNDTIAGGKGNDTLKGGSGSDVFVWNKGDGNDLITDYDEEDEIQIASGKINSVKKNGKNVIFTVGSNKITVAGAASKIITYVDASGKTNYYPAKPTETVILTDSDTTAVLRETYNKSSFLSSDYSNSIKKIDASSVTHDLSITGNGKANLILGGEENDTIIGGKSNDTLQGGTGADTFIYANGDGKDIILDYAEEDTIKITKGTPKITKSGDNVVFTVGSGKITVANAANKTVTYLDAGGNKKTYGSAPLFIEDDTDYELTPNLSSIVQSKSTDYSFLNVSSKLTKDNNLIAYSGKK